VKTAILCVVTWTALAGLQVAVVVGIIPTVEHRLQ
jgi:hypothetical protein